MPPDQLSDVELLVEAGIDAARAGDHDRARDLLSLAVSQDGGSVRGWLWLSGEVDGLEEKAYCLRQVLALEPGNEAAWRGLAWLREQVRQQAQAQRLEALRQAVVAEAALEPAIERVSADPPATPSPTIEPGPSPAGTFSPALEAGQRPAGVSPAQETLGGTFQPLAEGIVEKKRERTDWPGPEPAEREQAQQSTERSGLIIRNEFTLIAVLGLLLLALVALGVEGLPAPLPLLRLFLGLAFVLFVPGYALQAALFPREDALDGPERLALSFGLSVAVVPVLALILDRLPWGIRLWPIVVGEGLVIAVLSTVALLRRRRLPAEARPVLAVDVDVKGWWAAQDRTGRVLYGVLAGALLLALASAAAIILLPKPGELFTEFYILGPEGLAESYPRQAAPGEALTVTAGIANREGQAAGYRIEVQVDGQIIGAAGPVTLQAGEVWEAPVTYALPRAGDDQQVEFLLYRDGGPEPYRRLRLWINVVEEP